MDGKITYHFQAKIWQYKSGGGWHFVSIPKHLSMEIREHFKWQEEGWGRMKVKAELHMTQWDTSIWFDTKAQTYLLPVKAGVRQKLKLSVDDLVEMQIFI